MNQDETFRIVEEAGIYVYIDPYLLAIRTAGIESRTWKLRPWTLVYSEDGRGNETYRDQHGLIPKTVKRLRQLQILDDLASV